MEAPNTSSGGPLFSLLFTGLAAIFAWFWTASNLNNTYPWLVRGDMGGPAMLGLCCLSFVPAGLTSLVVVMCDRARRATRVLTLVCVASVVTVAFMVLLLFLWPYYQTGGFIEYSIFPEAYAPYTWGAIGDGFRWLALTVVFPWGPYLASMCLAVLIFSLVYRHYWFTKQERLLVLGTIAMCGALFCVLLPLWISQLIWFY